jgi:TonB family protein
MRARARTSVLVALAMGSFSPGASAQPAPPPAAAPQRVITPPKLVQFVEADFPPSEAAAGRGATVVLQIAITATGDVADVSVLESAGAAFDSAAAAAARRFVFEPAAVDGNAIPVKITYRYVFTFHEKIVKKTTGDFAGVVRERGTKAPLINVRVALDTLQQTLTDEQGVFSIPDVAPGERTVTLSGERIATVATTETFEAAKRIDATYEVETKKDTPKNPDEEEEIVVTAPRIKKQVISTLVQAAQATRVPGTQGDVLKVVENMPGVARAAVGSGTLVVWGSASTDTRVYIDGVYVPRLYHDGGYRSIVNSDFVQSVELIPGGYGSEYGRGLGGLVNVALKPLDEQGYHGSLAADTIDASASMRAKVGDFHIAVAARKSYLDSVLSAVTSENVGEYVPIPRYWDGQARIVYDLGPHETVELGALVSSDTSTSTLLNPDPSLTTSSTTGTNFNRVYFRYRKKMADGSIVEVTPSFGTTDTSLNNLYGQTPTTLTDHSNVFGMRANWRGPVLPFLRVSVGLDALATLSDLTHVGSIGEPPREGDIYVFGEAPPSQVSSDDWKTGIASVASYVEGDFSLFGDRLHLIPGARFEPFVTSANKVLPPVGDSPNVSTIREDTVLEPRLAIRYAFTPAITAKAAYGIYHQSPQPEDLSSQFGTPTLGLSTAEHFLAGGAFQLTPTLSVEVTGFFENSWDLTVRTSGDSPIISASLDQAGIGRSYGTQLLVRQQLWAHFFGWISYSILRSERKDAPDLDWRLFDFDQSHVFTAIGSYDFGHGFEAGARFRFATGYPRTPVVGAYFNGSTDTYEPIFGAQNSIRIPPFYALDLRVSKRFKLGSTVLETYLDVQNVTNHSNPEEIVYNTNYTQKSYITGLPILPVIGARFSW